MLLHLEAVTRKCSVKKVFLENFAKFTLKHLCQSVFFNKVAGFRPATLIKKRLCHRCIPVSLAKFLRTPVLIKRLQWLLLYISYEFVKESLIKIFNDLTKFGVYLVER